MIKLDELRCDILILNTDSGGFCVDIAESWGVSYYTVLAFFSFVGSCFVTWIKTYREWVEQLQTYRE